MLGWSRPEEQKPLFGHMAPGGAGRIRMVDGQSTTPFGVIVAGGGPAVSPPPSPLARAPHTGDRAPRLHGWHVDRRLSIWMTFHDRTGEQVIHGIAQEVVDRLMALGASPDTSMTRLASSIPDLFDGQPASSPTLCWESGCSTSRPSVPCRAP